MKRLLTTGLVVLAISGSTASFAQNRNYSDDIYSDPRPAKEKKATRTDDQSRSSDAAGDKSSQYNSSQYSDNNSSNDSRSYDSRNATDERGYDSRNGSRQYSDEYSDYDNDYYYSSCINRFNYPFYNRPYYSTFYNPYWYDPFWVDPYWGWSPWARPGFSVSVGMGPYWSSYWGWSSWYGCSSFGSYYGYPGFGLYGGYYSGYWNGYYAGLYNYGYGRYRAVNYGPRYSLNGTNNHFAHAVGLSGFRREAPMQSVQSSGIGAPRSSGLRTSNGGEQRPFNGNGSAVEGRMPRNNSVESPRASAEPPRSGGWFGRSERSSFSGGRGFGGGGGRGFGGGGRSGGGGGRSGGGRR